MADEINNVLTTDTYADPNVVQFGPNIDTTRIAFSVGNNPVYVRYWRFAYGGTKAELDPPTSEQLVLSSLGNTQDGVAGCIFRSAVAGAPARITATRLTKYDGSYQPGTPFAGTVGSSGGLTPPAASVNVYKNGVLVAAEPGLDLDDAAAVGNPAASPVTWTVTDNAGNYVSAVPVFALGVQHNDAGQVNEAILDFSDQAAAATPGVTWALTDDAAGHRVKVKPTITGVLTLLADSGVLGSSAASIDFQNIPATFGSLLIEYVLRSTAVGTLLSVLVRFNNDSGANYNNELDTINNGIVTNQINAINQTAGGLGEMPGTTAPGTKAGYGAIRVPGYAGTTFHKAAFVDGYVESPSGSAASQIRVLGGSAWDSTAAINRVTIFPGSGSVAAGSRVVLYGL